MNIINKKIYENLQTLPPDISGWGGDNPLFRQLIDKVQPKTIIEVGTWKGQSAINMAQHIKQTEKATKIYCVDTWLGATEFWTDLAHTSERDLLLKNGYPQIYYQFLSNVVHSGLQDIIIPFPNTSTNAARYFSYNHIKADLIYIDGSHEYEDVLLDLQLYTKLLNSGGTIFGDDYHECWKGVDAAVDEFFKGKMQQVGRFWIHDSSIY